jgi:hypothetical protein
MGMPLPGWLSRRRFDLSDVAAQGCHHDFAVLLAIPYDHVGGEFDIVVDSGSRHSLVVPNVR